MFNIVRLDGRDSIINERTQALLEDSDFGRPGLLWGDLPCPDRDPAAVASHAVYQGCISIMSHERCAIHDLDNFYRWWPRALWKVLCNPGGDHKMQLRVIRVQDPHAIRIGERQVVYPDKWDMDAKVIPVRGLDPDFIETILPRHFDRWDIYLGPGADDVSADYR